MAAVVARGGQLSPSLPVQEKGSRNKRKFRADTPPPFSCSDSDELNDNNGSSNPSHCSLLTVNFPNYEIPDGKNVNGSCLTKGNCCNMCCTVNQQIDLAKPASQASGPALAYAEFLQRQQSEAELDGNEFHDAEWDELTEAQLEELVLGNLDAIYQSAIKRIASCGFSLNVAKEAVLKCQHCYGSKDPVSNIVDNVLALFKNEHKTESKDYCFQDLQELEKHVLDELVCVLKEMRPCFSTGDALWCLLICDMNVAHACAMDIDAMGNFVGGENAKGFSLPLLSSSKNVIPMSLPANSSKSYQTNDGSASPHVVPVGDGTIGLEAVKIPSSDNKVSINQVTENSCSSENILNDSASSSGCPISSMPKNEECVGDSNVSSSPLPNDSSAISKEQVRSSTEISLSDAKCALEPFRSDSHRRHHLNNIKRAHFRQKDGQSENGYRGNVVKASSKPSRRNKHAGAKWNPQFSPGATTAKYPPQEYALPTLGTSEPSLSAGKPRFVATGELFANARSVQNTMNVPLTCPSMPTDPSLSLASERTEALESNGKVLDAQKEVGTCGCPYHFPYQIFEQNGLPDAKDEKLLRLLYHARDLQTQMQQWTEWAQQKIMQAARRLSKDKVELKTLRQEKEEAVRMVRERQTLEDNTLKKLSDMETAILKTTGHLRHVTANTHRLELENITIQKEMEAAKMHADEAARDCLEVSKREKKTLTKISSLERHRELIHEELATEMRKQSHLQQQVLQAKESLAATEERWRQEEKAKGETLARVNTEKEERRQLEYASKLKEDAMRNNAETYYRQYRDDILRLESEIARLRLKTDSSKIAALRSGVVRSYASHLTASKNIQKAKDSSPRLVYGIEDFQDSSVEDVERERECVMCLTEEMSVVFLPCAHQVVCLNCNALHEKQGMKDCPSCRAPIQQRISVRFAES